MRFVGKVAVVTGAGRGIGAATCRRLAAEGATVVATDIDEDSVLSLAAEVGELVRPFRLDVGNDDDWLSLERSLADGGITRTDLVVNNAFTLRTGRATDLDPASWDLQLRVDLSSVFYSVRTFMPRLNDSGGAVVNVASVHAVVGYPGHPAYAAAKGGMVSLTRQLAVDYGPAVRINAVIPGAIKTMVWDSVSPSDLEHHADLAALKRLGRPEEVASVVAFLGSDDATYITGECVVVDGGLTTTRF